MKLSNMATALRKHGLTVVETAGWSTRGYAGQDLQAVRGVLWHHTATGRGAFANSDAPTLNLCINGRSDLPGPLCQIVFGRNGTVYLTAAGVANHAGRGIAPGIPENMGNHYLIGIEMESSGVAPFDWTEDQKRIAPYLGAALESEYLMGLPADQRLQLGHLEYSYDGKIDPAGWPGGMDGLRASINKVLSGSNPVANPTPATPTAPVSTPVASTTKPDTNGPHWIVAKGDTLTKIARHYNGPGVAQIKAYNSLKTDVLKVGQKVYIPGPLVWIVEKGDTGNKIAEHYGISWDVIKKNNNATDRLEVGQVLTIWE